MAPSAAGSPAPQLVFNAKNLFTWLEADSAALQTLTDQDKGGFLGRIRQHFAIPEKMPDLSLFRSTMACIKLPSCPKGIASKAAGFKTSKSRVRKRKRNFIDDAGLHVSDADRKAFLDTIPVYKVKALPTPYPPFKKIVSETPGIHKKWYGYFKTGYQADKRKARLAIHHLNPKKLQLDIGPTENARILGPDGKLVGLVIRNFCPSDEAVAWADDAVESQVSHRRNIRVRAGCFFVSSI